MTDSDYSLNSDSLSEEEEATAAPAFQTLVAKGSPNRSPVKKKKKPSPRTPGFKKKSKEEEKIEPNLKKKKKIFLTAEQKRREEEEAYGPNGAFF